MDFSRIFRRQSRQFIIDPGNHACGQVTIRIFQKGGRRVDDAPRHASHIQRPQQGGGIGEVAVHQLLRWRRGVGRYGEGGADIMVVEIDDLERSGLRALVLGMGRV